MNNSPLHTKPSLYEVSEIEERSEMPSQGSVLLELLGEVEVVCEGPLQQFKPGFSTQFMERWCQLTPRAFRYYKSQLSSRVLERKPLFLLPRTLITDVRQHHSTPEERQGVFREHRNLFELVLSDSTEQDLTLRPQWSARSECWRHQHLLFSARTREECMQWMKALETTKSTA